MKKTIILVATMFALASCNTNAPETTPILTLVGYGFLCVTEIFPSTKKPAVQV